MNVRVICFCALMILTVHCFAQEELNSGVTNVTKVSLLVPGVSYEKKAGQFQTVFLQAFLSTSAYYSYSSSLGSSGGVYFDPALKAQYRFYYNAARRAEKEKRTEMNSLNYVAPVWETVFSKSAVTESSLNEDKARAVHSVGVVWGLQRNYKSRFSLDLNLGAGYLFTKGTEIDYEGQQVSKNQSMFTPLGQLSLGFWLNKRK